MTDSNRALVEEIANEAIRRWNADGRPHLSTGAIGPVRIAAEIALAALVPAQEVAGLVERKKPSARDVFKVLADYGQHVRNSDRLEVDPIADEYVERVFGLFAALSPPSQGVEKPRTWEDGWNAGFAHMCEQRPHSKADVSGLVEALKKIKAIKPKPIGDSGFATGPLAHFQAAKRIASDALAAFQSRQEGKAS